jgi:Tfp pilus assembly protein PilF
LFREGLYHEARRELLSDIGADPAEPALHLLTGHVYDKIGLKELAAEAFEEVRVLSTR